MARKTLDAAVAAAYRWTDYTPDMPDDDILRRLLALNLERAWAQGLGGAWARFTSWRWTSSPPPSASAGLEQGCSTSARRDPGMSAAPGGDFR